MESSRVSTCIITNKIEETKKFYTETLKTDITFDCGWYISLRFGQDGCEIQFMSPQKESDKIFLNQGVTYNIHVEDVDLEYEKLVSQRVEIVDNIADHPWGDRSFVICDPNGVRLYIYSDREPTAEFLEALKE